MILPDLQSLACPGFGPTGLAWIGAWGPSLRSLACAACDLWLGIFGLGSFSVIFG